MQPDELGARLRALGYITQEQMGAAVGTAQYNVSRYLSGIRAVPRAVAERVARLEADPPVHLSESMRIALADARAPGDAVPPPDVARAPLHVARVDWEEVYGALKLMGAIEYREGVPYITPRGWAALTNGGTE